MALMDSVGRRPYMVQTQQATQGSNGFSVSANANGGAGIGAPAGGFTVTILVVLGGLVILYGLTRRIQGA